MHKSGAVRAAGAPIIFRPGPKAIIRMVLDGPRPPFGSFLAPLGANGSGVAGKRQLQRILGTKVRLKSLNIGRRALNIGRRARNSELQPAVSNRAIADALGISSETVDRDTATNVAPDARKGQQNGKASATNVAPSAADGRRDALRLDQDDGPQSEKEIHGAANWPLHWFVPCGRFATIARWLSSIWRRRCLAEPEPDFSRMDTTRHPVAGLDYPRTFSHG